MYKNVTVEQKGPLGCETCTRLLMPLDPPSYVLGQKLVSEVGFHDALNEDHIFVDKSLFIAEIGDQINAVQAILRPRRFGKTTNLEMLRCFLDKEVNEANPDLFSNLLLTKFMTAPSSIELELGKNFATPDELKFYKGRYFTIFLDMKEVSGDNWSDMHSSFLEKIFALFRSTKARLGKMTNAQEDYYNNCFNPARNITFSGTLYDLTFLASWVTGQKVYLLIDDFDHPHIHAFKHGFYRQAEDFFARFYLKALKSNDSLDGACLMGTFEVIGGGILSGLNNVRFSSFARPTFSNYFGFTENEVKLLLKDSFLSGREDGLEVLKSKYSGYMFGNSRMMNPFSVTSYLSSEDLNSLSYWTGFSILELIASQVSLPDRISIISALLEKPDLRGFALKNIDAFVDFSSPEFFNGTKLIKFCILYGYLAFQPKGQLNSTDESVDQDAKKRKIGSLEQLEIGHQEDKDVIGYAYIPNEELRSLWKSQLSPLFKDPTLRPPHYALSIDELIFIFSAKGNDLKTAVQKFYSQITEIIKSAPHDSLENHRAHHKLVCAMFYYLQKINSDDLFIIRNYDYGPHYSQLVVRNGSTKTTFIYELKPIKHLREDVSARDSLSEAAKTAMMEAINKKYPTDYEGDQKVFIGLAFFFEQCSMMYHFWDGPKSEYQCFFFSEKHSEGQEMFLTQPAPN